MACGLACSACVGCWPSSYAVARNVARNVARSFPHQLRISEVMGCLDSSADAVFYARSWHVGLRLELRITRCPSHEMKCHPGGCLIFRSFYIASCEASCDVLTLFLWAFPVAGLLDGGLGSGCVIAGCGFNMYFVRLQLIHSVLGYTSLAGTCAVVGSSDGCLNLTELS